MKKKLIIILVISLIVLGIYIMYILNIIPHKSYDNEYFGIETYHSKIDKDEDGVDDASDMLESAKEYIKTKPKYKSVYYGTGYPNDEYGVCTDVVAFSLLNSGYDIMMLLNEDVKNNKEEYDIDIIDKNIDFRRVLNLNTYLKRNAISLSTDLKDISSFQGGDIIVFKKHIGIISDKRNKKGIPYLIHHASKYQRNYEEDVLELYKEDIIGHYRIS